MDNVVDFYQHALNKLSQNNTFFWDQYRKEKIAWEDYHSAASKLYSAFNDCWKEKFLTKECPRQEKFIDIILIFQGRALDEFWQCDEFLQEQFRKEKITWEEYHSSTTNLLSVYSANWGEKFLLSRNPFNNKVERWSVENSETPPQECTPLKRKEMFDALVTKLAALQNTAVQSVIS